MRTQYAFMCPICDEYRTTWSEVWSLLAVSAIQQGLAWLHNGDYVSACRNYVLVDGRHV